jgi:hypothetical protein
VHVGHLGLEKQVELTSEYRTLSRNTVVTFSVQLKAMVDHRSRKTVMSESRGVKLNTFMIEMIENIREPNRL